MTDANNTDNNATKAEPVKKPKAAAGGNARKPKVEAGATSDGGPRIATVASRIEHDSETYDAEDIIPLTEAEFEALLPTGALVEKTWDDCSEF